MFLDVIVVEVKRPEGLHVNHAECGRNVLTLFVTPATPVDVLPRTRCEVGYGLIGLALEDHISSGLAESSGWSGRSVRTDENFR